MKYLTGFKLSYTSLVFSLSVVLSSLILSANAEVVNTQNTWRLNKDEEGIQVFLRNNKITAVKSFKGIMTVKSSMSAVLTVIGDVSSFPRWLYSCRSAQTLKSNDEERLLSYIVLDLPWPVMDRDTVMVANRSLNKSTKRVEIKMHAEPKLVLNVPGKVRIKTLYGRWLLTPVGTDKVNINYEMTVDPGGNIPVWLVNSMIVDLPFYTLLQLREVIKEDKYANAKIQGVID